MNIKSYSDRLDVKKQELAEELQKPEEEQNKFKIKRLEESIRRNKNIARRNSMGRKVRKWRKWRE